MDMLNNTLKELGRPVGVSRLLFIKICRFFKTEILFLVAGSLEMVTTHLLIFAQLKKPQKPSFCNKFRFRDNI